MHYLRSFTISALGKLGDASIINEAESRFKKFLKNPNSLAADIREPVYSLVAWNGNSTTHKKLNLHCTNKQSHKKKNYVS